jgi:peptidoglycan/xylan/chitin deacetylase (PgdA/CDA1 family)
VVETVGTDESMNRSQPRPIVPVLAYHSISDERRDGTLRWSVSPGDFDEQMALLASRGRTALTVSGYAAVLGCDVPPPARPVLVTFDDGFADLATTALPTLRRYGITATAYVITSALGTARSGEAGPALDWDQLEQLRANGVEVGSHSHTHRPLDCLSAVEVFREVNLSKQVLEGGLREPVSSFAYPYGYHSWSVRQQVQAAGYTSACGVKNALSHPDDDVFAIARVLVQRDMGTPAIEALLDHRGWPIAWRGERLRTRGWRTWRRARHLLSSARARGGRPVAATVPGTDS